MAACRRGSMHDLSNSGEPVGQRPPSISVVVPVYNSRETLDELCSRLEAVMRKLTRDFEVVLVDDGSRDGSADQIRVLGEKHDWVRPIRLVRNYGQHNALLCGIRQARGELTVTLDDDLQNPPEEIPKLLQKLDEGYDVVYGVPEHEQHGLLRDVSSRLTKLVLQKAMGADVARSISAYRAIRTPLRDAFAGYDGSFVSIDVLLTWATTRFAAQKVAHEPRSVGSSSYTVGMLITHAVNLVTGFSSLPLQLASLIGFSCTLVGVALLVFVVGRYLIEGVSVPGFAFLASMIAIFSGAQLFSLGIIGEYLVRMHFKSMGRPPYVEQRPPGRSGP